VLILGLAAPAVADLRGGAVPLSEHEQRLLEQMEKALYAEDPKLASTLRGSHLRPTDRRRLVLGILAILLGAWDAIHRPAKGTVGQAPARGTTPGRSSRRSAKTGKGSFMDRLEQRWDRRRDGQ
jgi:hypothetical protein